MYQSAHTTYNAMRCEFLDREGNAFIERIKTFVANVKMMIVSLDGSNLSADEAMHRAMGFLNQQVPDLSDAERTLAELKSSGAKLEQVNGEVEKMKRDIASLKKDRDELEDKVRCLSQSTQEEKKTRTKWNKNHNKLLSEVKEMKVSHITSMHLVEKNLTTIREFIKRNAQASSARQAPAFKQGQAAQPLHQFSVHSCGPQSFQTAKPTQAPQQVLRAVSAPAPQQAFGAQNPQHRDQNPSLSRASGRAQPAQVKKSTSGEDKKGDNNDMSNTLGSVFGIALGNAVQSAIGNMLSANTKKK